MNNFPLKKGQTYKQLPNGEMVVVEPDEAIAAEVEAAPEPPKVLEPEPVGVEPESPSEKASKILEEIKSRMDSAALKLKEAQNALPTATEEDKYTFLKALISNNPFKKEYRLLNDKLKVTFRTVSTAEAEAVTEAIVIQSERVPYSNLIAMSAAHMKYSMACSIVDITTETEEGIKIKQFESPLTKYSNDSRKDTYYVKEDGQLKAKTAVLNASPGQKVIWAATESFSDLQIPIYNMIFGCFQKFDVLVAELVKESANPDFFLDGAVGP